MSGDWRSSRLHLVGASSASAAPSQLAAATNCNVTQAASIVGKTPTRITFVNDTSGTVEVYWLDYHGREIYYYTLYAHRLVRPADVGDPPLGRDRPDDGDLRRLHHREPQFGDLPRDRPGDDQRGPCTSRYPSGVRNTTKGSITTTTSFDRQASLYSVCEGFGVPTTGGFQLTPTMQCAIIAAAAAYGGGPVVSQGVSDGCEAGEIAEHLQSGRWLGGVASLGCGFFSDVFATSAGIFAAGVASETGPGAVAVGVTTWRALTAGMKLVCGGVLTGLASQLGVKLEGKHETAVAIDVIRNGRCLRETRRAVVGLQWSAVPCTG